MAHIISKDIHGKLGKKIDELTCRAPWNDTLYSILKELYTDEEADLVVRMPYVLSNLDYITKITGYEKNRTEKILKGLCNKGLVMDLWLNEQYHYMVSPMIIGIFEFTMMRTGSNLNSKEWARLFHDYLSGGGDSFYSANGGSDKQVSVLRTLPHEEAINESKYIEVLDYEKAASLVEESNKFSIGLCSCRHEKQHLGEKDCDVPLETCISMGLGADYLIRNNLAKEVSKTEILESMARSKEMGLVFNADNIKKNIMYMCQCCGCCCNAMAGLRNFGIPNVVVTSRFIAESDEEICNGCSKCAKACPINAIEMIKIESSETKKKKKRKPVVNREFCLGCGVCSLKCKDKAMTLVKRKQRVILPENVFEKVILGCLERGTLQNQILVNPGSLSHKFMRGFVGGFFRLPPVKMALMSDLLRSSFLTFMRTGAKLQGRGWMTRIGEDINLK